MKIYNALFLSSLLIQGGNAYSVSRNTAPAKASAAEDNAAMSRRNLLRSAAALSAGALLGNVNPGIALADDDVATPVYFGVGVSSTWKECGDIFLLFDMIHWISFMFPSDSKVSHFDLILFRQPP